MECVLSVQCLMRSDQYVEYNNSSIYTVLRVAAGQCLDCTGFYVWPYMECFLSVQGLSSVRH